MTVKAGQKCTAIRRAMAPAAISRRGRGGDPRAACEDQGRRPARRGHAAWARSSRQPARRRPRTDRASLTPPARASSPAIPTPHPADRRRRLHPADPASHATIRGATTRSTTVEAFGPVSTIMPYNDMADAIALANRGMGSLALSLFTHSPDAAREFVQGAAAYHGRMLVIDRDNAAESTGHGSPLPVLVHGGPGRAGGSEEMGGIRGVKHYMQRTAIQSTPAMIAAITEQYIPGAPKHDHRRPPLPPTHERARTSATR